MIDKDTPTSELVERLRRYAPSAGLLYGPIMTACADRLALLDRTIAAVGQRYWADQMDKPGALGDVARDMRDGFVDETLPHDFWKRAELIEGIKE